MRIASIAIAVVLVGACANPDLSGPSDERTSELIPDSHHDYRIYLRDPQDIGGEGAGANLELGTTLPAEARDTGLRQEGSQLWMIPDADGYISLVTPDSIERWPQGFVSCA